MLRLVEPPAAVDPEAVHQQPSTEDGAVAVTGYVHLIKEYSVAALGRLANGRPGIACESDDRNYEGHASNFVVRTQH